MGRQWSATIVFAAVLLPITLATAGAGTFTSSRAALDGTGSSYAETTLGDFIADAERDQTGADAAVISASEIRPIAIAAGQVDIDRLSAALASPSDTGNTIVVLKLTGAQIRRAFERALSRAPTPYDGFLQVSAIRVVYDSSKASGSRITELVIAGHKALAEQAYLIATSRHLADGALGYFDIWSRSDIVKDTAVPLTRAVADFAASKQPLDYHIESRISGR
ncbi:MAG: 5'-nucleotidase [Capsulimonadaceae bacterium]|nr:5'-nucleotidase [Capsulimonadaceae bacterium]